MNNKRRTYSTGQVANKFGVDERTVRRWSDDGTLAHTRTLRGVRRFDADHIDKMAAES